jgi:hypothetical protein
MSIEDKDESRMGIKDSLVVMGTIAGLEVAKLALSAGAGLGKFALPIVLSSPRQLWREALRQRFPDEVERYNNLFGHDLP